MGGLFGKPKPAGVTQDEIDQRTLEVKIVRDRLVKSQRQQEALAAAESNKIREAVRQKKTERAKFLIRQKRLRQVYIDRCEQRLAQLQAQLDAISTAQLNIEFIHQVKVTNDLLTKMDELMPVEEVERVLDEQADLHGKVEEVSRRIAQDISPEDAQAAEQDYDSLVAELFGDAGEAAAPQPDEAQEDEPRMAALA
jgi:charged multivesicular body protein 6